MKGKRLSHLIGALALCAAAAFSAEPVMAFDLSGKRVQAIVPFNPGTGTDIYARLVLPHLEKYLPGNPTINIINQPGAGTMIGANKFERAAPDGETIFVSAASTLLNFVNQDPRAQYNPAEWEPIIASPQGAVVYVSTSTGVTKPEEIKNLIGKKMTFGANSPRGADITRLLMFDLLDLDMNIVFGTDPALARQAFERGELNIAFATRPGYLSHVMPVIEAGKASPIFAYGYVDDAGKLIRDPEFPDLPHFGEAYKAIHGKEISGIGYETLLTLFSIQIMANKVVSLPKGTPKEIVETYRTAIAQVLEDPEFQKGKDQAIGNYPQSVGKEAAVVMARSTQMDEEKRKWLASWLEQKYDVKQTN